MAAAGIGVRGHAHHQHRREQHGRLQQGSRPRWSRPLQRTSRRSARISPLAHSYALGELSSPSRRTRCVPLPRLQPNSGSPEFGHLLTGRSRINPTSAGGTGRGHTPRFVLATPSPTLPRKREREQTEIAGTSGESWHLHPLIPAHSASKTRVNALLLGIQRPRSVALGPRWSSPPRKRGRGRTEGIISRRPAGDIFDYIATTLLTT